MEFISFLFLLKNCSFYELSSLILNIGILHFPLFDLSFNFFDQPTKNKEILQGCSQLEAEVEIQPSSTRSWQTSTTFLFHRTPTEWILPSSIKLQPSPIYQLSRSHHMTRTSLSLD